MNTFRSMVMVAATCAAGLSLAACAAGVSTAGPARSSSPSPSRAGASTAATRPATPQAGSVRTVTVDAPIGSFPVPTEANVIENVADNKSVAIILGSVSPAEASSFYLSALPRAGYKITGNTLVTGSGTEATGPASEIDFTGHGYKGTIGAISDVSPPAGVNLGNGKNIVGINLTLK